MEIMKEATIEQFLHSVLNGDSDVKGSFPGKHISITEINDSSFEIKRVLISEHDYVTLEIFLNNCPFAEKIIYSLSEKKYKMVKKEIVSRYWLHNQVLILY